MVDFWTPDRAAFKESDIVHFQLPYQNKKNINSTNHNNNNNNHVPTISQSESLNYGFLNKKEKQQQQTQHREMIEKKENKEKEIMLAKQSKKIHKQQKHLIHRIVKENNEKNENYNGDYYTTNYAKRDKLTGNALIHSKVIKETNMDDIISVFNSMGQLNKNKKQNKKIKIK